MRTWTHRLPPQDGSVLRNPLVVLVREDDWHEEGILLCICAHIVLVHWETAYRLHYTCTWNDNDTICGYKDYVSFPHSNICIVFIPPFHPTAALPFFCPHFFHHFVVSFLSDPFLYKDLLTTRQQSHIHASASVVDRVTSSETQTKQTSKPDYRRISAASFFVLL